MARAPPSITTTSSSSPATIQQVAPAPVASSGLAIPASHLAAPHNHSHAPVAPIAPAPPVGLPALPPLPPANPYQQFSFPAMFNNLPSSSVPTIGKAFPGTSTTSSVTSLTCSQAAVGTLTKSAGGLAVVGGTAVTSDNRGKIRKLFLTYKMILLMHLESIFWHVLKVLFSIKDLVSVRIFFSFSNFKVEMMILELKQHVLLLLQILLIEQPMFQPLLVLLLNV